MASCAFDGCAAVNYQCALVGGCVVTRFAHVPKYVSKNALNEGLKLNARKGEGPPKPKQPKRR